jgi:tripartite-type tricarboxylate transporter receptor subunit TctC
MLPAGAPPEVAARLNKEFNAVMAKPEIRERLQAIGAVVGGGSVESFTQFSHSEIKRYEGIVRISGAPKE